MRKNSSRRRHRGALRGWQSERWEIFMIITHSSQNDKANWWDVQAYDRKRMACGTWAGWFKWQVIEQQTRIKTVLMSSVFHLGSIRRLVEAEANTCSRERLQSGERWESIDLLRHRIEKVLGFVYLTGGLGENSWLYGFHPGRSSSYREQRSGNVQRCSIITLATGLF